MHGQCDSVLPNNRKTLKLQPGIILKILKKMFEKCQNIFNTFLASDYCQTIFLEFLILIYLSVIAGYNWALITKTHNKLEKKVAENHSLETDM